MVGRRFPTMVTKVLTCADCEKAAPATPTGWLRCPDCERIYCPTCPGKHRMAAYGECDSTQACGFCGATCLVDL